MANYEWQRIGKPLGEGGQGVVYLARSPQRCRELAAAQLRASHLLQKLARLVNHQEDEIPTLGRLLVECGLPDPPEYLGALKEFKIPKDDPTEEGKALGRLDAEIKALKRIEHPAVLRLLHDDYDRRIIVTEYHARGTLDKHLRRYLGMALGAFEAFEPLVEAVAEIHRGGFVHRDIKPVNIFVANDGHLVLGDFGIVYFETADRERLTKTRGERVGSRDWIAPWVDRPQRFEKVDGKQDVYALGKVLWSMVAGQHGFLREEWNRPENDLVKMFPNEPAMSLLNEILAKCVVREEGHCLESAAKLLALVQGGIAKLRVGAEKLDSGPWRCRACGNGMYAPQNDHRIYGSGWWMDVKFYVCDQCRHVQMIQQERG